MSDGGLGISAAAASALTFGSADFLGGSASRRNDPLPVAAAVQTIGLGGLVLIELAVKAPITAPSLILGAVAGIGAGLGLGVLYRALARASMGVVLGLGSVVAASLTLIADAALRGVIPSPAQLAGVACAVGAAWIAATRKDKLGDIRSLALAALAGAMFGVFFLFLDRAAETSPLSGLIAARATGAVLLLAAAGLARRPFHPDWRPLIAAGLLDGGASGLFVASLILIPVGLATAVSAANTPLVAMVLAWLLLGERVSRVGLIAVGLACTGIALIAVG